MKAVDKAKKAFDKWRTLTSARRAVYLERTAKTLRAQKEKLGRIITLEMGKTLSESVSEVVKCAWALEYYAENGERFLNPEPSKTDATDSYVSFEPLGVIASIMPWNFPLWQTVRFAAPTLMAGNTTVFKPSSVTPQSGLALTDVLDSTGIPPGCFNNVLGRSDVSNYLITANTAGVSFTGSVSAGRSVAELASKHLKKVVLELGGSDPFIVLDDADVEAASSGAVAGRFINCGQSCIASKRFFVAKSVADDFQEAVKKGAQVETGGERIQRNGFFYHPTILTSVKPEMRVMKEETFGPVAPVMDVKDDDEAVELANRSDFGLGASVWGQDIRRAEKVANQVATGLVSVNNLVVSDPRMPFGGVKNSGVGRELSRYGLLEFANIKSVRLYEKSPLAHARVE